ncbi:MAG: hypothetical protein SWO11_15385 [Thermodesulfobacteriota bacterium]|nr:hypothetical protein [Thermodesulfobacteriota bacterium]
METEGFSVHTLGQFKAFKVPGLYFKCSGGETEWTFIKADDRVKIVTDKMLRVNNIDVPYESEEQLKVADYIHISGFENERAIAFLDKDQRDSFVCEKCSHQNVLS